MTGAALRELACATLLKAGVERLPIRLRAVAQGRGIEVLTYGQYAEMTACPLEEVIRRFGGDGFTQQLGNQYVIFYYERGNLCRMRWTLAHELGHILLEHLNPAGCEQPEKADPSLADPKLADPSLADPKLADPKLADPSLADPKLADPKLAEPKLADRQADLLAAELLCPGVVLRACGCTGNPTQLSRLCDISPTAALCRVRELARPPEPTSPGEAALLERMSAFIARCHTDCPVPEELLARPRSHRL